MSHEQPGALTADELAELAELERAELEGTRDTPLPPTHPDPPPLPETDRPPPRELEPVPQGSAADPAGAIMISAPQRPTVMGFFPTVSPPAPVQGAASGFWPRK
jgi:hypothetical protein